MIDLHLAVWVLMLGAGGHGPSAVVQPMAPMGVYDSAVACDKAMAAQIEIFRHHLVQPRSGRGYAEGGISGGGNAGRQFYLMKCERWRP